MVKLSLLEYWQSQGPKSPLDFLRLAGRPLKKSGLEVACRNTISDGCSKNINIFTKFHNVDQIFTNLIKYHNFNLSQSQQNFNYRTIQDNTDDTIMMVILAFPTFSSCLAVRNLKIFTR